MPIKHTNDTLNDLSVAERIKYIYNCYTPEEILITSSFGSTSAYLLYHISNLGIKPDVYFINTGYHFSSTVKYRDDLAKLFNLNIIEVKPNYDDHSFTEYEKLWETDADSCCFLNKVKPLNAIKNQFKVWVTGLLPNEYSTRSKLSLIEKDGMILKYNPFFDKQSKDIRQQLLDLNIPRHPLIEEGYDSIGCLQCTSRGEGRTGRWAGLEKKECGLHSNINKKATDK